MVQVQAQTPLGNIDLGVKDDLKFIHNELIPELLQKNHLEINLDLFRNSIEDIKLFLTKLDTTLRKKLKIDNEDSIQNGLRNEDSDSITYLVYSITYSEKYLNFLKRKNILYYFDLTYKELESVNYDFVKFVIENYPQDVGYDYVNNSTFLEDISDYTIENSRELKEILDNKKINIKLMIENMLNEETDMVNPEFRVEMRKFIAKRIINDLGKPPKNKSYISKDLIQARNIVKTYIATKVNSLENHGFKVFGKRELNTLVRNTDLLKKIKTNINEMNIQDNVDTLNTLVTDSMVAKSVKLTDLEKSIVLKEITKQYNEKVQKYNFGLEFKEDFNTLFNKEMKKINLDFRNIKTVDNYLNVQEFEEGVVNYIDTVLSHLFEQEYTLKLTKQQNYRNVLAKVFEIVNTVCTFDSKDEVSYQLIKNVVNKLSNNNYIDEISFVDETMTALIKYSDEYNQNEGLFLINPYTLIEVYNQRVYADTTKQIILPDTPLRANRLTSSLAKYFVENLKSIYAKRNNVLNIFNAPLSNSDMERLSRLVKVLSGNKLKENVLNPSKIKFAIGNDTEGNPNRIQLKIKSRNLIISPAIIYDVEEKKVLFKRENPNSTLTELENSLFKPSNPIKNIEPNLIKVIQQILLIVFDLRKGQNTLDKFE